MPIWKNSDLIATIEGPRKARIEDAERFAEGTAKKLGVDAEYVLPAFEDPCALAAEGSRPAAQCRSQRFQTVRSGRALAHGAGVRSGPQHAQGIRAADPALECRRANLGALEERALEASPRQSVPDAGRFPARAAAADRLAAAYSRRRISLHRRAGSAGAARGRCRCRRQRRRPRRRAASGGARAAAQRRRRRRAHRDVDRDPRRHAVRLHAAGGEARGLSRTGRGGRGDRRRDADAGACRGLSAAVRPARRGDQGDARSRRDRGQHPARRRTGAKPSTSPSASTKTQRRSGWAPTASWSTAATPAPAAAIMSWSAAARRGLAVPAPARSAEELWCCTGSGIRRCPICSRACSSARPARRRASTRRATTASTNWRSRWPMCRRPISRRRCGWSTGCSGTSWSTSPATPTAPKSASTSSIRPTARPAGSGWSNSARSKCRRTRACAWRSNC